MTTTTKKKETPETPAEKPDPLAAYRLLREERTEEFTYAEGIHTVCFRPVTYDDLMGAKRDMMARLTRRELALMTGQPQPGPKHDEEENLRLREILQNGLMEQAGDLAAKRAVLSVDGADVGLDDLGSGLAPGFVGALCGPVIRSMAPGVDLGK